MLSGEREEWWRGVLAVFGGANTGVQATSTTVSPQRR